MYTVPCIGYPHSPGRIIRCNEIKTNIVITTTLYLYVIMINKLVRTLFIRSVHFHMCAVGGSENRETIFSFSPSIGLY